MQTGRVAVRTGARLSSRLQRHGQRHASDTHGQHTRSGPANESLGRGFYIAVAAIPLSLALYKFSRQGTDSQPYFTRLIKDTYDGYKTKWAERNDLHTQAMEQAAADRALFLNGTNQNVRQVDLRFPEQFNFGSPWNVPAGHGSAHLDDLIAKYEKEAFEDNEKKLEQLRENKVPVEQPYTTFVKVTPAANDS